MGYYKELATRILEAGWSLEEIREQAGRCDWCGMSLVVVDVDFRGPPAVLAGCRLAGCQVDCTPCTWRQLRCGRIYRAWRRFVGWARRRWKRGGTDGRQR
ncbi:MAG: hypothetical protein ACYTDW_09275 [Planctomycetota bacterium]